MPQCYMCEADGDTVEHAPPRCIFPASKDTPDGADLRRELITVPACEQHNSAKSKDDEFLMYLLAINLPANVVAQNQFLTKILRAIEKSPGLIRGLFKTHQKVIVRDNASGAVFETMAGEIDRERFDRALDCMARALYFHHFGERWLKSVRVHPEFLLSFSDNAVAYNNNLQRLSVAGDLLFKEAEQFGKNPSVFKYQVNMDREAGRGVIRLHFYDGVKVLLFLGLDEMEAAMEPALSPVV